MQIKIDPLPSKEGYFVVTPHGSIDNDTYTEFHKKINNVLSEDTKGILIDLKEVDYITSAGLGVIFSIKKYLMANQGELVFCNLKPQIKKLFDIVKALPKETLFRDIEEADKYFYTIMNQEIEKEKAKKKF